MKEKNLSLELVKFFAVILVANHWMAPLYIKYKVLSTGGAIGDVLFFFASGFTLFLGRFGRFDNWYKRRIKRIYPSVIAFAGILTLMSVKQTTVNQIVSGGGLWFVKCIMIYYVVLYFIRRFAEHKPLIPFLMSVSIVLVWYMFEDSSSLFMYGGTYFKWGHYFLFMLLGAYLGNKTIEMKSKPLIDAALLVASLVLFYGLQILAGRYELVAHLQIITLLPLMGVVISIYKLCSIVAVGKMMRTKIGLCLRFVAGLCLEIYIVSDIVINQMIGKLTDVFPFNLLATFFLIVAIAYLTRGLARIFSQIFEKDDMDWKEVFRLV